MNPNKEEAKEKEELIDEKINADGFSSFEAWRESKDYPPPKE